MMVSIVLRLLQFQNFFMSEQLSFFFFAALFVIMQIEGHESTENVLQIKYFGITKIYKKRSVAIINLLATWFL